MPELKYVADHLEKRDCRRLVAALHDSQFDLLNNMDVAGVNSHSNIVFKLRTPYEDTLEILYSGNNNILALEENSPTSESFGIGNIQ